MEKLHLAHMRLTGQDGRYYQSEFALFQHRMVKAGKANYLVFGKQDTRGAVGIHFFSEDHTISRQIHFDSKDMLIGYVVGANAQAGEV